MSEPRKIIIDTDPGQDDAAAQVVWPTEPHPEPLLIGGPDRRASRGPASRTTPSTISAPLVQLVSRFSLEEALDEGAHPASLAYLEKLAEVLADGVLTLRCGQGAFLPASNGPVTAVGSGELFLACPGA